MKIFEIIVSINQNVRIFDPSIQTKTRKVMKTVKINNQEIKLTKKFIREILTNDRAVSYYTKYDDNELASVISFAWPNFVYKEDPIKQNIDSIYNQINEIISSYEWYQKELKEQVY